MTNMWARPGSPPAGPYALFLSYPQLAHCRRSNISSVLNVLLPKLWRQSNYNTSSLSVHSNLMSSDDGEEPTLAKVNYALRRSSYNRKLVEFSSPTMEFLPSHRESADSAFQTSRPLSAERVPLFQLDPYGRNDRVESFYRYVRIAVDNGLFREFSAVKRRGQRTRIHSMGLVFARRTSASCPRLQFIVQPQSLPSRHSSATLSLTRTTYCMNVSLT